MKHYLGLAVLATIVAAAACTKEIKIEDPATSNLVEVSLSVAFDNTKATLTGNTPKWENGDVLAVYDGVAVRSFTYNGTTFSGSVASGTTNVKVAYPYTETMNAGEFVLAIPAVQTIASGKIIDSNALVASGAGAINSIITLSSAGSLLRFTVAEDFTTKVTFHTGHKAKGIAGTSPVVEITVPGAGTYNALVNAGTYEGIHVFALNAGAILAKDGSATLTLATNQGKNLGTVDNGSEAALISNAAELTAFLADPTKDAYVVKDLDLDGVALATVASFNKVFDGQDYSIKNWTSNGVALFGESSGTIKNLVLDSTCSLHFPTEFTGAFGFVVKNNTASVSGLVNNAEINTAITAINTNSGYLGSLVGESNASAAVMSDCVNNANVTVTFATTTGQNLYFGGVSGRTASDGNTIKNCTNRGNIRLAISAKQASTIYMGGVSGSTNNNGVVLNCKNYGDVTYTVNDGGAAVVMGGVSSYTAGTVTGCINEGNVTYTSSAGIKGTVMGGVYGYAANAVADCVNKGNVTCSGNSHEGRNTVGNLDGTKSTSTATALIGGVVGAGSPWSATVTKFKMTNCENSGNVSYTLSTALDYSTSPAAAGRHCVGGLVADASGPIMGSKNSGAVSAQFLGAAKAASSSGLTLYVGGLVGANYFSTTQTELNITDSNNTGSVYVKSVNQHTTSHAVGGIVGWPGKESSCTSITSNCTNTANVTVEGNIVTRVGGIQGGSGRINNCSNSGIVTGTAAATSCIGGVAGFHSGGYQITGTNTGKVVSGTAITTGGVGGFIGLIGNAAHTTGEGSIVNCAIEVPDGVNEVGMVVGRFNGKTKTIVLGSTANPIRVSGSIKKGSDTITIDADNFTDYLCGPGNYVDTVHTINASFAE